MVAKRGCFLLVSLMLSACADPQLLAMNRETGEVGKGVVMNSQLGSSGPMSITFASETYNGRWVAVDDAGRVAFGAAGMYGLDGSMAWGSGTGYAASTGGNATAMLTSNKGNSMRCQMRYNSMSMTAAGVCQRQDGAVFDMQMTTY